MFRVTRYPMISKTESGQVWQEIPGSGSGSGTRLALLVSRPQNQKSRNCGLVIYYRNHKIMAKFCFFKVLYIRHGGRYELFWLIQVKRTPSEMLYATYAVDMLLKQ